jgi:adenylate cyclase
MHHNSNFTDKVSPNAQPPLDSQAAGNSAESQTHAAFEHDLLMPKAQSVILVCDVVESVRWMEHDEDNAIARWSQFATEVRGRIAPAHEGRVVKSTGDGLMIEFKQAPQAVAAAHALHSLANEGNQRLSAQDPERQLHLRIGIHQAEVRKDAHDLYGHGVNLAARITMLAGPGEIIVTPEVRDHITDSLDGEIEDMGECYLKHLSEPQRVYRVGSQAVEFRSESKCDSSVWSAAVAVLPTQALISHDEQSHLGLFIADSLIGKLSRSEGLKVLSRLSTQVVQQRFLSLDQIAQHLKVDYVVVGSHVIQGKLLVYLPQLIEAKTGKVLWAEQIQCAVADLFVLESDVFSKVSQSVQSQISEAEVKRAQTAVLPTMPSYSALLAGIVMMHRGGKQNFELSQRLLETLIDRHPKSATPKSWMAKWYVLQHVQSPQLNTQSHALKAIDLTQRALQYDECSSLSLAMQGYVYNQMLGKPDQALSCLNQAIALRPSEPMAWLFRSVIHAMAGEAQTAVTDAETACALSPFDPLSYFFQSISASSCLSAQQYDAAAERAKKSLKLNSLHMPTYRVLFTAQYFLGLGDEARQTLVKLKSIDPQFSLQAYRSAVNAQTRSRQQVIEALTALEK